MKNIRTILFAALAFVAAMSVSCSKEDNARNNEERGTISVSVNGMLGEFAQSEGTKSGMVNTVRVKWVEGDKVYAYDAENCLGELTVSVKDDNGYFAMLNGKITAPAGNKIFLVHGNALFKAPAINHGKVSVDLSQQANPNGDYTAAPFVTYGTMEYSGKQPISNQIVDFKFASSIMRLNCTGLEKSAAVASAKLTGFSNECVIDLSGKNAAVGSGRQGDIELRFKSLNTSANGAVVFYVSMAKNEKAAEQTLEVKQPKPYEWSFGTKERGAGQSINAICQMTEILPYVVIPAKYDGETVTELKWYRQNLAISPSGNKSWKGGNNSAVKIPGTGEDVINGDYFQWAAYEGYCQVEGQTVTDRGLLIYNSFTSTACGDGADAFSFKSGKTFATENAPYYDGSAYSKYNATDKKTTLVSTDDVANIILGVSWRMPTSAEFKAMKDATYWSWDATDKGYYVYAPNPSTDAGKINGKVTGTYNKSNALLFFPAAGSGFNTSLLSAGSLGYYWSSSRYLSDDPFNAFGLYFHSSSVYPQNITPRFDGFTVRPVSD